jgi:hypothetical protein
VSLSTRNHSVYATPLQDVYLCRRSSLTQVTSWAVSLTTILAATAPPFAGKLSLSAGFRHALVLPTSSVPFRPEVNPFHSRKPTMQEVLRIDFGLLQPGVFRFSLLEDRDVRVSVFPEGEKIFVGSERPDAGGVGIRSLRGSRLRGVGR